MFAASTAFHAIELGFRTTLVEDASRGINNEGIENTFKKIKDSNGCIVSSKEVSRNVLSSVVGGQHYAVRRTGL